MKWFNVFCLVLFTFIMFNCSKDNGSEPKKNVPDIKGWWLGSYSSSLIPETPIYLQFRQNGDTLSGFYQALDYTWGKISGIIKDDRIEADLEQQGIETFSYKVFGTFRLEGAFSVSDSTISFTFTGTDTSGTHENGSGTVQIASDQISDYVTMILSGKEPDFLFPGESGIVKATTFNIDRSNFGIKGFERIVEFADSGNRYYIRCYGIVRDFSGVPYSYHSKVIASIGESIVIGYLYGT